MIARTVVVWIIVLASFLVLAIIIGRALQPASYYDPQIEACAQQIKLSSQLSTTTKGDYATEIDCPTKEVTISGSDEEQKHQLAKDMVACHELWAQDSELLFDKDAVYCHVCSFIEFEDSGELEGLSEFMQNNPEGTSYLNQIAPIKTEDLAQQTEIADSIDRDQLRATIFLYARGEEPITFLDQALFSKDALDRPLASGTALAAGTFALKNGGHFVIRRTVGLAAGAACGAFSFGLGAVPCAVGATFIVEGTFMAASVLGADYWANDPPQYAAFVVQDEWRPEVVRELGCEIKA